MKSFGQFPLTHNNQLELLYDGQNYNNTYLQCIRNAQKYVFIQTYIFELDQFGRDVHHELILAKKRNVQVFLLVDDFGSKNFDEQYEQELTEFGVFVNRFNPLNFFSKYPLKRRLHHKLLITDGEIAIIGGINIVYPFDNDQEQPRLDFALKISGPILSELTHYAHKTFQKSYTHLYHRKSIPKITRPPLQNFDQGHTLRISINDWFLGRYLISEQYKKLIFSAKSQITILNSYFFPRKKFRKYLISAQRKGVRVRLILPKISDWRSYVWASEYLYAYFLRNGVEIYQWDKSIMHGKLATIDDSSCTLGSFNLNYTSFQQNLEMNVDIFSKQFTNFMNNEIENQILPKCIKINPEDFLTKTSIFKKATRFFFFILFSTLSRFLENQSAVNKS